MNPPPSHMNPPTLILHTPLLTRPCLAVPPRHPLGLTFGRMALPTASSLSQSFIPLDPPSLNRADYHMEHRALLIAVPTQTSQMPSTFRTTARRSCYLCRLVPGTCACRLSLRACGKRSRGKRVTLCDSSSESTCSVDYGRSRESITPV